MSPHTYESLAPEYQSKKLYFIFWLSVVLILLELFQLLEKPLMLGLLVGLAVIGMFVLHRFSPTNVKCTIGLALLSVFLDVVWSLFRIKTYLARDCGWGCLFNIYEAHHKWPYEVAHPRLHYAIAIIIVIALCLKLTIAVLLCSFRHQTDQDNERSIRLFGHELIISDEAYAANPHGYGYSPQQTY